VVYQYNLPASKAHLEAIGMVASEWQRLEAIINAAIWSLAWTGEEIGNAITAHLNVPNRLHILRTLFHLQHPDEDANKTLKKLCDGIGGELSRERAEVVHALWVRGEHGSPLTYVVRARGELKRDKRGKPAKIIKHVAERIAAAADELVAFLAQHGVGVRLP
jgi:hypothetical protein